MSDFSSMNTTQLMIEANRLRKKLKKRRGGFGFDNTPDALGRLFGRSSTMGNDLLGGSVMGAIARKLSKRLKTKITVQDLLDKNEGLTRDSIITPKLKIRY